MKKEINPIENAVTMFREWKGDSNDDYVYDEIHEFTVDFSRAELAGLMNYLEKNEKALTSPHHFTDSELLERDRKVIQEHEEKKCTTFKSK